VQAWALFADLWRLQILSNAVHQPVILLESPQGSHRGLVEDPTEKKDSYRESDLPCQRRLWTPPYQGQRQGPHATDREDNERCSEIPLNLFPWKERAAGCIHKLTAVFALYRLVLNFFSAEGTLFHYHLSRQHNVLTGSVDIHAPGQGAGIRIMIREHELASAGYDYIDMAARGKASNTGWRLRLTSLFYTQ
jgi:hypothetical protein